MGSFSLDYRIHELAMTREKYLRLMETRKRPLDDHIRPHNTSRTTQQGTRTP